MTPIVSANSTPPATVRCASARAGIVWRRWNGAYSGVPLAVWNSAGCTPNSTAVQQRGRVEADVATDAGRDRPPPRAQRRTAREREVHAVADERHDEGHVQRVRTEREHTTVAEEERLDRERDRYRDDCRPRPEQDRDRARAPTACAVVPSGTGTLNIITQKQYAAASATSGAYRFVTTLRTRRPAVIHTGVIAPAATAHVLGLRYPSGMCTPSPPCPDKMLRVRRCEVFVSERIAGFPAACVLQ